MKRYLDDFTRYGQDPSQSHLMYDYFDVDLEFIPYIGTLSPIRGRDKFIEMETSHPSTHEILEPVELVVDEKRLIAAVVISAKLADMATGKVLVEKNYFPLYQMVLDKDNKIKITKILFFEEVLKPGSLDVSDVLGRDVVKNLFAKSDS